MSESETNQVRINALGPSILLCTPVLAGISPSYMRARDLLRDWCAGRGIPFDSREVVGAPVDAARDVLAAQYMASPYTHCLMIDAGVGFTTATVARLLAADEPFTAAAVPLRYTRIDRAVEQANPTRAAEFAIEFSDKLKKTGRMNIVRKGLGEFTDDVVDIGAACILVKREVFERVFDAYPERAHRGGYSYFLPTILDDQGRSHTFLLRDAITRSLDALTENTDDTTSIDILKEALHIDPNLFDRHGEDVTFCELWRRLPDAKIWLLLDAPLVHEGHGTFCGNFHDALGIK